MTTSADWVDGDLYPFRPRYFATDAGRLHYVDEGDGPVVVMVHGTPTWSFLYRRFIQDLSRDHRVIAVDHLGFGLSDKPGDWAYRPEDHARNLERLIEHLALHDITLVVHDFGGPIGLAYATRNAPNVRALVLFNTWLWSLAGTAAEKLSRLLGGAAGRFLYTRLNFSARVLVRAAFADKAKLSAEVHRHYIDAFPAPADRVGTWVFARELIGSSEWYDKLREQAGVLAGKPALLLWGLKDAAFGGAALGRWQSMLPRARTVEFARSGHFVQEEAAEDAIRELRGFLASTDESAGGARVIGTRAAS